MDDLDDAAEKALALTASAAAGVPAPIAQSAIKAVSRLVGAAINIAGASLLDKDQELQDRRDARTLVTRGLAAAASTSAVADPEMLKRAMLSFAQDSYRKQENKENVALLTLQKLEGENVEEESPNPVEDDWMNVFSRYVEDASSGRMQDLWAKVLAGEIRRPGAFSLPTMRFIAELDPATATDFETLSKWVFGDWILTTEDFKSGKPLSNIYSMQAAGLIVGDILTTKRIYTFPPNGVVVLPGRKNSIVLKGITGEKFSWPCQFLSRTGRELLKLTPIPDELALAQKWAGVVEKPPGLEFIEFYERTAGTAILIERLWPKVEDDAGSEN